MMMQKLSKRTWGLILASLIFVLTLLNTNQPLLQLFNLDFAQLAAQPWWLRLLSFAYYLVLVIALGWWLTRFGGLWLTQKVHLGFLVGAIFVGLSVQLYSFVAFQSLESF